VTGGRWDDILEGREAVEEGFIDGRVRFYGREGDGGGGAGRSWGEVRRRVSLRVFFLDDFYLDHCRKEVSVISQTILGAEVDKEMT
jgi:hypothetical protein